jgi:L-fuculose-phosphate aldolase
MWDTEKKMVLGTAQQMVQKGLVVGNMGNVSMRLGDTSGRELLAITPSGRYYDSLDPDDIVIVDFDGKCIEGKLKPSVETMLHIEIYKTRKKVNAIVHSHPVFGSVVAVAGMEIPAILDDQVVCLGGGINVAEYAPSGSLEMVRSVVSALGERNAVIMANHGALSVGSDMRDALTNCEILEKTARIYVYALGLGKINLLQ